MGKTRRNHPYQKKYDTDIVYKVTIPKNGKRIEHSIIDIINSETIINLTRTTPQFSFINNDTKNVEKISLGKRKKWEEEFDLPVLQTEYYHAEKIEQRVKVPDFSSCAAGACNAQRISSGYYKNQKMTNMTDEEKDLLAAEMKKKKDEYRQKRENLRQQYGDEAKECYVEKPRLENIVPFSYYKQVIPVTQKHVLKKELHKTNQDYCKCCLQKEGRIWMLRGNGDKALCKNKGMRRIQQREYNDLMTVIST
jgi:hypothetical protein